jgi:outer membrane protein with beta-barrel domain
MPVNEKNGNKGLLEQGWHQMQSILDQEMPQKHQNKWVFWIPLGALGVVLAIIALMYFPVDKANETAPQKQADPHPSFAQSEPNAISSGSTETLDGSAETLTVKTVPLSSSTAASSDSSETLDVKTEVLNGSAPISGVRKEILNSSVATSADETETLSGTAAVSDVRKETLNSIAATSANKAETLNGTTPESDGNTKTLKRSASISAEKKISVTGVEQVALIATVVPSDRPAAPTATRSVYRQENLTPIAAEIVSPATLEYGPQIMPILPAASQIRPKVGLEVFGAPHFGSSFELRGIEAGALASLTLGRKWKLLGGISYGHYNKNGINVLGGNSANADAESITIPLNADTTTVGSPSYDPTIAYSKIGYDTARLLIEKFNYLHLPVVAQYRIGRFISVTGGLKVSYLLNAPSGKIVNGFSSLNAQSGLFDLNTSRNFLAVENILRKWDIAPIVGIAFDIGRRMAFDIQYQHGLIPYVDRPTEGARSDYQRTVSLALRYRIF